MAIVEDTGHSTTPLDDDALGVVVVRDVDGDIKEGVVGGDRTARITHCSPSHFNWHDVHGMTPIATRFFSSYPVDIIRIIFKTHLTWPMLVATTTTSKYIE